MTDKCKEYKQVAALLAMDIDNFARAFPDNVQLQALAKLRKQVIENEKYRNARYEAGMKIVNLKRNQEYLDSLPEGHVNKDGGMYHDG